MAFDNKRGKQRKQHDRRDAGRRAGNAAAQNAERALFVYRLFHTLDKRIAEPGERHGGGKLRHAESTQLSVFHRHGACQYARRRHRHGLWRVAGVVCGPLWGLRRLRCGGVYRHPLRPG